MARPRALTEDQEQDACQRYATGWTVERLAQRFGCGETAIRRMLYRRGVKVRPQGRPRADVHTDTIVQMRDGGATWWAIADATGISYNAVRKRYLKAKGLPIVAYKAESEGRVTPMGFTR